MVEIDFFTNAINRKIKLSDQSLSIIIDSISFRQIRKKEFLIKEGQIARELYFLVEGKLRTFLIHDGIDVTTWVALAGAFDTSAHSFLKGTSSFTNLQAISDCKLIVISHELYDIILNDIPEGKQLIIKILQQYYLQIESMLYYCLSMSAEERYKKMEEEFPEHFKQVPQKYLASMIRVREATLSRLKKKLSVQNNKE